MAHPPGFTCVDGDCNERFDSVVQLQEHRYDKHGVVRPKTTFMCRQGECGQRFQAEDRRNAHEMLVHGSPESATPPVDNSPRRLVCGVKSCTQEFGTPHQRGAHRRTEHPGWTAGDIDASVLDPREKEHFAAAKQRAGEVKKTEQKPDEVTTSQAVAIGAKAVKAAADLEESTAKLQEIVEDAPEPEDLAAALQPEGPTAPRILIYPGPNPAIRGLTVYIWTTDLDVFAATAFLNDKEPEDIIGLAISDAVDSLRQDDTIVALADARASFREKEGAAT